MAETKGDGVIRCEGGDGRMWVLVNSTTGEPVRCGDTVRNFRGETTVLTGGRPPQHAASTGRVWTEANQEFFPGVFNLVWRREAK